MEMKVIQAFGPADLRVVNIPIPSPADDQVLIKVRATGVCGSDKWVWYVQGHSQNVPGHEVAGEVVNVGKSVKSLSIGDRVIVNNVVGCGHCPACRAGAFVQCEYWDGTKDVNNGYGEYVVAPARNCQILNERLSYAAGVLLMDNWGTPYGAIKRMPLKPGDVVVVFGLGPIGQAAVALLKHRRAYVVGVDPVAFRREHAAKLGADRLFAPDEDIITKVKVIGDEVGAHFVLDCSGKTASYETGLALLRVNGMFVTIGEEAEYMLHPSKYVLRRGLSIQGTWYSTMPQVEELQQMVLSGQIEPEAFVTHRLKSLDELPEVFGQIIACQDGLLKCIVELA